MRSDLRMIRLVILLLTVHACIAASWCGIAQDASEVGRNDAGYWYKKAAAYDSRFTNEELNRLAAYLYQPQSTPPDWVADMLVRAEPMLELLRRGGGLQKGTLGTSLEGRPSGTQMPFRIESIAFGSLLWADAQAKASGGDTYGAAASVAAMYDLAVQFVGDSAYGASDGLDIYRRASEATGQLLDQGLLDPTAAATVLYSVQRLDEKNPFRSFEYQTSVRLNTFERLRDAPDDARQLSLFKMYSGLEIESVNPESLDYAIEFVKTAAEIYALPDREKAERMMRELVEEAKSDPRGELLWDIDGFVRVFRSVERTEGWLRDRRESLQHVLRGEDTRNAAQLYRMAVAEFEMQRDAFWRIARADERNAVVAGEDEDDGDNVDRKTIDDALAALGAVFALLDEASLIEHCDFGENVELRFMPDYTVGLAELQRVLALRAEREFDTDHHTRATETLALKVRIARHLASDENLLSPMIAHGAARTVNTLATKWYADAAPTILSTTKGMPMRTAFQADDPFGYGRSVEAARERVSQRFAGLDAAAEKKRIARTRIDAWNHDTLLAVVMYIDTGARGQTIAEAEWRDRLPRVSEFIHEDAIRAVWAAFPVEQFSEWARAETADVPEPLRENRISTLAAMMADGPEDWGRIERCLAPEPKKSEDSSVTSDR